MGTRTTQQAASAHFEHAIRFETERMIQRGRTAAFVLAAGLVVSFGSERSLRITLAILVFAVSLTATHVVLRRPRSHRSVTVTGWASLAADVAVCAIALSAVADPVDPISAITFMIAIETAVRWGSRGAVLGGLLAGGMGVVWAANAYAAVGRDLPGASVAFRLLSVIVIALPVGLLIERLRQQQERTRRLFETSSDAIVIVADHRIVDANPVAIDLVKTPVDELVGQPFAERFGSLFETSVPRLLGDTAEARRPVPIVSIDGRQRWMSLRAEAAEGTGLVFVIARDATDERMREEELRFRAWHDPLTGLPNRAALRARLMARLAEGAALGVVFLDLDDFKEVNDLHGHLAGDDLLIEVADRLRQVTRESDAAYRWAGDEFCLVVNDATPEALATMAERIAEEFSHAFRISDEEAVHVNASVGTAMAAPSDTEESLLARADEMMYRTKQPRLRGL